MFIKQQIHLYLFWFLQCYVYDFNFKNIVDHIGGQNHDFLPKMVIWRKRINKDSVTCEMENCVYYWKCKKSNCKNYTKCEYIGLTRRSFKSRFSEHKQYAKSKLLDKPKRRIILRSSSKTLFKVFFVAISKIEQAMWMIFGIQLDINLIRRILREKI